LAAEPGDAIEPLVTIKLPRSPHNNPRIVTSILSPTPLSVSRKPSS
jgi:hypothetical protein